MLSFERNGFEEYEFIANGGCCDICQGINGKHFKVKDMMPGENAPPLHPRCRCSCAGWENSAEYEAWLDYLDKGGTTQEWNDYGKASWMKSKAKTSPKLSSGRTGDTDGYTVIDSVESFDFNDSGAIKKEVAAFFNEYADAQEEHAVVISPVGKLFRLTGTRINVNTALVGEDALRGSIGIHNHPVWDGFESGDAFSRDDVRFTVEYKTGIEYLVSGNRRCSFEYTGQLSPYRIVEEYEKALDDARSIAFESEVALEYEQETIMRILAQRLEGVVFDEDL